MSDDTIIIKAPAGTKARWVRQSQRAGVKLSDWIIKRVERNETAMQSSLKITIPAIDFSDLKLVREATGNVSFDTSIINRIERASGLPEGYYMGQPEDALGGLIVEWYAAHIAAGGGRDPVADDLIAEARMENAAGQPYSHAPRRA